MNYIRPRADRNLPKLVAGAHQFDGLRTRGGAVGQVESGDSHALHLRREHNVDRAFSCWCQSAAASGGPERVVSGVRSGESGAGDVECDLQVVGYGNGLCRARRANRDRTEGNA